MQNIFNLIFIQSIAFSNFYFIQVFLIFQFSFGETQMRIATSILHTNQNRLRGCKEDETGFIYSLAAAIECTNSKKFLAMVMGYFMWTCKLVKLIKRL